MNAIDLYNFLQNLIDEDVIEKTSVDNDYGPFGKNNVLYIDFIEPLKLAVVDADGNMIPFVCGSISYSSNTIIEFYNEGNLYLSRPINEINKIHWKMNVRMSEN